MLLLVNTSAFEINLCLLLNIWDTETKCTISGEQHDSVLCLNMFIKKPVLKWAHESGPKWLNVHRKWINKKWRTVLIETTFWAVTWRHRKIDPSILGILIAAITRELKLFEALCQTNVNCLFFFWKQQWERLTKWKQITGFYRNSRNDHLDFWLKITFYQLIYLTP